MYSSRKYCISSWVYTHLQELAIHNQSCFIYTRIYSPPAYHFQANRIDYVISSVNIWYVTQKYKESFKKHNQNTIILSKNLTSNSPSNQSVQILNCMNQSLCKCPLSFFYLINFFSFSPICNLWLKKQCYLCCKVNRD